MGEQRDACLLAHKAREALACQACDVGQLFCRGLDFQRAVGEGEHAVLSQIAVGNLHQEDGAYHGGAGRGFQHAQRRGEDLHGCAACTAYQAVDGAGLDHHGGEVHVVGGYQLMGFLFGHALLLAKLEQEVRVLLGLFGGCGVDDLGAFQVVTLRVDFLGLAQDNEVGDALLQGFLGSGKDAVVEALGQDDGLLVGLGAFDHRIDERGHKHSFRG